MCAIIPIPLHEDLVMATNAPGKHYRKGITVMEATRMFDTDAKAAAWFARNRWPEGVVCPHCGSRAITPRPSRKPQPYRCRTCRKYFSETTGTLLHRSHIPLHKWAVALYLYSTNLKSVSSMKLHRDLGITQRTAWFMAHRIRQMWADEGDATKFKGPVEVDETFVGGLEKNKHADKRLHSGRGPVGKTPVVGVFDRATGKVKTEVVEGTDSGTLQSFIVRHTDPEAEVNTDDHRAYIGMPRRHVSVNHSAGEYVRGDATTNSLESHWAMLKKGIVGTFHHLSAKHLERYTTEFAGRHNNRELDTEEHMEHLARGADGKRLTYAELIGPRKTAQPSLF